MPKLDEEKLVADLKEIVQLYRLLFERGGVNVIDDLVGVYGDEDIPEDVEERKRYVTHRSIERKNGHYYNEVKRVKGYKCEACTFDFRQTYGPLGDKYIEVHHLVPLSELREGESRKYNLKDDFVVLCSNCHRMIHRKDAPKTIEKFKKIINSPYARTLFVRKFTSSFIDAIFAATNNLYLIAK